MLLIGLDGRISEDTGGFADSGSVFGYPEILSAAIEHGRGGSVVAIGARVYWMIVVPVLAPVPIAFVGAVIPLNDHVLRRMQDLAALPKAISLLIAGPNSWIPVAGDAEQAIPLLPPPGGALAPDPEIVRFRGEEDLFLASELATPAGDRKVVDVLSYPVTDALKQFQGIIAPLLGLLLVGLILALWGALTIARAVSRPIELLAEQTRRIEAGDYSSAPVAAKDEIGELSSALTSMTRAIRDREEHIRHQASHDLTTGLPNRLALTETMAALIDLRPAAVIVVGLVRLQDIAHTVGREIADRLMVDAGRRLGAVLGDEKLACIGERSFAVFAPGLDRPRAVTLCNRIIAVFETPYREGDLTIDSTAAIGAALIPDHGKDPTILLRRAEVALLSAMTGEGRVVFYDPAADPHRPELLSLMSDLRESLDQGLLRLYYQPKLDIEHGQIGGAEALVRWLHPERGFVPPDLFIRLAEETGNIQRLTRWALDTGITQGAAWYRQGYSIRVSINLSVRDLSEGSRAMFLDCWSAADCLRNS
jgi:GGDEF domain-containing protein